MPFELPFAEFFQNADFAVSQSQSLATPRRFFGQRAALLGQLAALDPQQGFVAFGGKQAIDVDRPSLGCAAMRLAMFGQGPVELGLPRGEHLLRTLRCGQTELLRPALFLAQPQHGFESKAEGRHEGEPPFAAGAPAFGCAARCAKANSPRRASSNGAGSSVRCCRK